MSNDRELVTVILQRVNEGVEGAEARLCEVVYDELRRLARSKMRREGPGHTLQTTALVNEACIRLLGSDNAEWRGRNHFFGAAARAMQRILVDHARRRRADKRGGGVAPASLDEELVFSGHESAVDILDLNDALQRLELQDASLAGVVRHRYFLGLTGAETAEVMSTSLNVVNRHWRLARAWLYRELSKGDPDREPLELPE